MATESSFAFKVFPAERSKNFYFNLGLETGGFSSGDTTSHLLMQPCHNTLYYTIITDQYNSPRIYCLFCTFVWQVLLRTEFSFRRHLRNSVFIFFRCDFTWNEQNTKFFFKVSFIKWEQIRKYFKINAHLLKINFPLMEKKVIVQWFRLKIQVKQEHANGK